MPKVPRGFRIGLSAGRKIVMEQVHHARKVPSLPLARSMNIAEVVAARQACAVRPSWTAIFMRAYGLAGINCPELRRAYIPLPYPHLYEHPHMTCGLMVEREWQGELVVLGSKILAPENQALARLDKHIRWCGTVPVWECGDFRQSLRVGGLPLPLRRFTFWQTLYLSGYKRAKRLGTFMMSSLGSLGVEQLHPLGCLTTYFTFGPIGANGDVTLKVVYDHRVMDGRGAARSLVEVEKIVKGLILEELRTLAAKPAAAA